MDGDREAKRGRRAWVPVWCLAVATSLLALVYGLRILDRFWVFNGFSIRGAEFLLLPLVFVPIVVIPLTMGRGPSRRASVFVVVVCLVTVLLGLATYRLLGQASVSDGYWYRGPGSWYEVAKDAPWHAWQTVALVYAGCGLLQLALSALVLTLTKSPAGVEGPVRNASV